jgi:hypothetical protein
MDINAIREFLRAIVACLWLSSRWEVSETTDGDEVVFTITHEDGLPHEADTVLTRRLWKWRIHCDGERLWVGGYCPNGGMWNGEISISALKQPKNVAHEIRRRFLEGYLVRCAEWEAEAEKERTVGIKQLAVLTPLAKLLGVSCTSGRGWARVDAYPVRVGFSPSDNKINVDLFALDAACAEAVLQAYLATRPPVCPPVDETGDEVDRLLNELNDDQPRHTHN